MLHACSTNHGKIGESSRSSSCVQLSTWHSVVLMTPRHNITAFSTDPFESSSLFWLHPLTWLLRCNSQIHDFWTRLLPALCLFSTWFLCTLTSWWILPLSHSPRVPRFLSSELRCSQCSWENDCPQLLLASSTSFHFFFNTWLWAHHPRNGMCVASCSSISLAVSFFLGPVRTLQSAVPASPSPSPPPPSSSVIASSLYSTLPLHNFLHFHCCTSSLVLQVCLWHSSHSLSLPAETRTSFVETHPHVHGVNFVVYVELDDCAVSIVSNVRILFIRHHDITSLPRPFSLRSRAWCTLCTPSTDLKGVVFSPKCLFLSPFAATNFFVALVRSSSTRGNISAGMTCPCSSCRPLWLWCSPNCLWPYMTVLGDALELFSTLSSTDHRATFFSLNLEILAGDFLPLLVLALYPA